MDEFRLISEHFDRTGSDPGVIVGIGDDGAVVRTAGGNQVHVLDTLVEDVHFPHDTPPADIAWRAVAVNLSDLSAMGAVPRWMMLGLTLPAVDESWVRNFSTGLFEAATEYGVSLIGGDTTRGAKTVVSISMTGDAPPEPLLRTGARVGDSIFVTGTPGDAAGGLALYNDGAPCEFLLQRFLRPTPRVRTGQSLVGTASAAIDVSDGLAGDLAKILRASGVGAEVDLGALPISDALRAQFDEEQCCKFAMLGGDDYELCFTAPHDTDIPGTTAIGTITATGELVCRLGDETIDVDTTGYRHFHD